MLKTILHRIFASLAQATGDGTRTRSQFTYNIDRMAPSYRSEVDKNLKRWFGMKVERRNPHIPELSGNQFDRDLASTTSRRRSTTIDHTDHTRYLRDGYIHPDYQRNGDSHE